LSFRFLSRSKKKIESMYMTVLLGFMIISPKLLMGVTKPRLKMSKKLTGIELKNIAGIQSQFMPFSFLNAKN
jgi:hypothetical protein